MGVRSRCLASLLAVLAATGAARAEEPPPAPAKAEASLSPAEAYKALRAAYDAERWDEVLSLTGPCFQSGADRDRLWWAAAMACCAASHLDRWDECIQYARVCSGLLQVLKPSADRDRWLRPLLFEEAGALIALGKSEEAARLLESAAGGSPDLLNDIMWRTLRISARPGDGILFDMGVVSPAEEGRLLEGRRRIEGAVSAAIARLRRRLGTSDLSVPLLRILVVRDGHLAAAKAMRRGDGWVGLLQLRVEVLLHPTREDELLLAHELAHVLHMSGTRNRHHPAWLAEGLAHWLEAEDDARHREVVLWYAAHSGAEEGNTAVSDLLESEAALGERDELSQRVGGSVILFGLERKLGTAAVRRMVLRLLRERDFAKVLREATGLTMPQLLESVRREYVKWIVESFPHAEDLASASALSNSGQFVEALAAVDGVLAVVREPAQRQVAEVARLQVLVLSGDFPAALVAARPIRALREARPLSVLVPEGVYMELLALVGSGDWSGAASLAGDPRASLWVPDPEGREQLESMRAAAESQLTEAAPPK